MADQESPFSQDAVPVNQSGRLTDQQAQLWARIAKRRRQSVRGVAVPFAAIGAILLFANGPAAKAAARANGAVAFLGIAAILVVAANLEPVNADVREGRVESVEGAIAKRVMMLRGPGSRFYALDVGGRRLRASSRAALDAAPDAGYVRVYFFPRSRRVVNLEQLPDPPIPTGSGAAQEIFLNFAHALRSLRSDGDRRSECSRCGSQTRRRRTAAARGRGCKRSGALIPAASRRPVRHLDKPCDDDLVHEERHRDDNACVWQRAPRWPLVG